MQMGKHRRSRGAVRARVMQFNRRDRESFGLLDRPRRWQATARKRKKKEKRKRNAGRRIRSMTAPGRARRALKRSALACRRSTAALAAATERRRSAPVTRFLGRGHEGFGRYPKPACPSPAINSQTGRNAGRASLPGAARERGDEPPPAGTALTPPPGVTGRASFLRG